MAAVGAGARGNGDDAAEAAGCIVQFGEDREVEHFQPRWHCNHCHSPLLQLDAVFNNDVWTGYQMATTLSAATWQKPAREPMACRNSCQRTGSKHSETTKTIRVVSSTRSSKSDEISTRPLCTPQRTRQRCFRTSKGFWRRVAMKFDGLLICRRLQINSQPVSLT